MILQSPSHHTWNRRFDMPDVIRSFKRAYDLHLSVKCLSMSLLAGLALLLSRISGGLPPPAWRTLAQSAPQLTILISTRGPATLAPFTGLVLLSLTWGALWLALTCIAIVLLWRAWFPARHSHRQARDWRRTSIDNLLESDYDEPQASLAYASAHRSFAQTASPSTPFPELPTRPKPVSKRAPDSVGVDMYSRPPVEERPGSRPPTSVRPGSCPPRGAYIDSRPPHGARPGSRPPIERRHIPGAPAYPAYSLAANPGEFAGRTTQAGDHKSEPHIPHALYARTVPLASMDVKDLSGSTGTAWLTDPVWNVGIG